jgi:hypothetical protein
MTPRVPVSIRLTFDRSQPRNRAASSMVHPAPLAVLAQ